MNMMQTQAQTEQFSLKKGLKVFGEAGADVVMKELKQLHDMNVVEPVDAGSLSHEQKQNAPEYLMFLKLKHCRQIKGWGWA